MAPDTGVHVADMARPASAIRPLTIVSFSDHPFGKDERSVYRKASVSSTCLLADGGSLS